MKPEHKVLLLMIRRHTTQRSSLSTVGTFDTPSAAREAAQTHWQELDGKLAEQVFGYAVYDLTEIPAGAAGMLFAPAQPTARPALIYHQ